METIKIIYTGDLKTQATHSKTGNQLITDAPLDNKGRGETFSPTDLLVTSLGTCMLTVMGIAAQENNIAIDNTQVRVTKIMANTPRRVSEVIIEFDMPKKSYSVQEKGLLENAAINCPVIKSMHPDFKQTIKFNYQD